jgi:hypothetical protein
MSYCGQRPDFMPAIYIKIYYSCMPALSYVKNNDILNGLTEKA